MEGRKWCIKIAQGCTNAGLTDLATSSPNSAPATSSTPRSRPQVGRRHERSDEAMALLAEAVEDSCSTSPPTISTVATKIVAILQNGAVSKSLFASAPRR